MVNFIETDQRYPGPRALGHRPVIAPDIRETITDIIDDGVILDDGVVSVRRRNDPAIPALRNPRR